MPSRALEMLVDVGLNAVSRQRGEFELECLDSIEPPDERAGTFVRCVAFSFAAESCEEHALDNGGVGFASVAEDHIEVIEEIFVGLFSLVDYEYEGAFGCGFDEGGAGEAAGFDAPLSGEGRSRGFPGQDGIWNECNARFVAEQFGKRTRETGFADSRATVHTDSRSALGDSRFNRGEGVTDRSRPQDNLPLSLRIEGRSFELEELEVRGHGDSG